MIKPPKPKKSKALTCFVFPSQIIYTEVGEMLEYLEDGSKLYIEKAYIKQDGVLIQISYFITTETVLMQYMLH